MIYHQKYYAVRVGHKPGIYDNWQDCFAQVNGYGNAEFKAFWSEEEAKAYLQTQSDHKDMPYVLLSRSISDIEGAFCVVGLIFQEENCHLIIEKATLPDTLNPIERILIEIEGVIAAVRCANALRFKEVTLTYHHAGVRSWATGEWKATNEKFQQYHKFMRYLTQDGSQDKVKVFWKKFPYNSEDPDLAEKAELCQKLADHLLTLPESIPLDYLQKAVCDYLDQSNISGNLKRQVREGVKDNLYLRWNVYPVYTSF